jgi:NADH dehydrogenase
MRATVIKARLYQPSKSAMQSGKAKTNYWILQFIGSSEKLIDPLMGWVGSTNTLQQIQLKFDSISAALLYARKHNITLSVEKPRIHKVRLQSYGDKFR